MTKKEEMQQQLSALREQINALDAQIVPLLEKRLAVAEQIAQVKHAAQLSLTNRGREQIILDKLSKSVTDPVHARYLRELYQDIFLISKQYQAQVIKGLQDQDQ
ncbi:chorismate mutase [Schleiferilactobacillus harbinensis]|jgi:monofunctional chorismate mutase|uniref:chorismate mutase n=1 Tax=Schleiferilactobacillus harbinensis TaxID=304207 RepID=UPI00242CF700|nr:chorismate mutase [Schleiferilactobacillus harbinensis]MCI1688128.1 chorismate mutase [Schleiferilactobacillus harbinensis]MCI1783040.1 chorismate mutase [Schleiferilactobacillus harbinensis]MCI1851174.1 chorismate mutase [Schleiferilactobacillus harbinensis]